MVDGSQGVCPGPNCVEIRQLRTEMGHHSTAVSDATLSIRECVKDIHQASNEVMKVFGDTKAINERLKEGVEQFKSINEILRDHDSRLRDTDKIAVGAKANAETNGRWIFWMVVTPLAALIGTAILLLITHGGKIG